MEHQDDWYCATLRGFVTPVKWNRNSTISLISIDTDEGDYVVEGMAPEADLFSCLRAEVEVDGFVHQRDGVPVGIAVQRHRLIP